MRYTFVRNGDDSYPRHPDVDVNAVILLDASTMISPDEGVPGRVDRNHGTDYVTGREGAHRLRPSAVCLGRYIVCGDTRMPWTWEYDG